MSSPIKFSLKTEIIPVLLVGVSLIFGIYFYMHFPDKVTTHWGFNGEPNGYMGKFWGAFGLPLIVIGIYLLFTALPYLDPKGERYASFANVYHIFKSAILAILTFIFVATGYYNLGYDVKINIVVPVAVGILFVVMGNYMGKLKNNWFIGVRTPWTLSSEEVWNRSNRFSGKMFVVFGLLIILTPFLPKIWGIICFVAGVALVTIGSFVYSYVVYHQLKKHGALH